MGTVKLYEILAFLLIFIQIINLYFYINDISETYLIDFHYFDASYTTIKPKIYFMYLPYYNPLFDYQRDLLQNCDSIEEADYLVMGSNSYFKGQGYLTLNWTQSYTDLIFSKKIIMMCEEDITINVESFNFSYIDKITAIIGCNEEEDLKKFFKKTNVFSHLIFEIYFENHNSSYEKFINRPFYIQSAISNINYFVNSDRVNYLKVCMDFFGSEKVANYGRLFHNKNYSSNGQFNQLPSDAYFGFSMENSIADYWITEKLFFMYRNDVVPIYRGSKKNKKILKSYGVNTKAFIDASDMSAKKLARYLNKLIKEKGKKRLYEIYKEPLIPDKKFFDQKIQNNFKKLLDRLEKA